MSTPTDKLMRSRDDKMIAGVASGIGRYLAIDPVIVRLVFIALAFSGIGLLLYPVLCVIMPPEPVTQAAAAPPSSAATGGGSGEGQEIPIRNVDTGASPDVQMRRNRVLGVMLVGGGAFILLSQTLPWLAPFIVPGVLVGAGILLLRRAS